VWGFFVSDCSNKATKRRFSMAAAAVFSSCFNNRVELRVAGSDAAVAA
jgi:hypothetical protein